MKIEQYVQTVFNVLDEAEKALTIQEYHMVLKNVAFRANVRAASLEDAFTDCVQKVKTIDKKGGKK